MKTIIRAYNKLAAVLLEYEVLLHRDWVEAVELGQMFCLKASLLTRHPITKVCILNMFYVIIHQTRLCLAAVCQKAELLYLATQVFTNLIFQSHQLKFATNLSIVEKCR